MKGTSIRVYLDDVLIFDVINDEVASGDIRVRVHAYVQARHSHYDNVRVYRGNTIDVIALSEGQKVELYDDADTLIDSKTVGVGETSVSLELGAKRCPFNGYFKVYKTDGVTLWYRYPETGTIELWGGDEYAQT